MIRAFLALSLTLVACASSPAPAPAPGPDTYPTPYTAQQLHDATRVGRRYEFRLEKPPAPPAHLVFRFLTVTPEGTDVENTVTDDEGHVVDGPKTQHATWDDLRKHAEFPRAAVATHEGTADTPAGRFACTVYVVTKGDAVSTFYFAHDLAGPPVLHFTDKGGARVSTSTLVKYDAGP